MQRTYDHKESTTAEAERLCERLGPGWEPRVWSNDGWHFEAHYKGLIHVYPSSHGGTWFCVIGECGMLASLAPEGIPHLTDPVEVVRLTVAGYRRKWVAFKAEQEELVRAGEECLKGDL
ncbi:MAG: hypothetical protein BWY66_00389 [bacterium ADurb.Bin374]|nr:MAG: hypothetical protein BWY66_00389 [bacterium ADurb.Bin374]